MNNLIRFGLVSVALSLTACGILEGDKINYRSASKVPTLEVPPDLSQLTRENRYAIPGSAVTASNFQTNAGAGQSQVIASRMAGDVRVESAGNQQWLVVDRPPEKLWDDVREFWNQNGFLLVIDQSTLGILETDWAENRAKIPQDIIRSTIGKIFDNLYSTGEQDKFRTRLERNAKGGTDIYISHRGMVEVYTSFSKDSTKWQPRPADAGLEAEFIKRLMLKLGGQNTSGQMSAEIVKLPSTTSIESVNEQSVLQVKEGFDRAWRRVGLSLDRTGFTVEDRDRSKGLYFVRYVEPTSKLAEPGFIAKLFSSESAQPPLKLRVMLSRAGEDATTVSVQNSDGGNAPAAVSQRIVKVLADDLK